METKPQINIGDIVKINFNNAQYTLCRAGRVLYIPQGTGDSWMIEDLDKDKIYYISEGCTITKNLDQQINQI